MQRQNHHLDYEERLTAYEPGIERVKSDDHTLIKAFLLVESSMPVTQLSDPDWLRVSRILVSPPQERRPCRIIPCDLEQMRSDSEPVSPEEPILGKASK